MFTHDVQDLLYLIDILQDISICIIFLTYNIRFAIKSAETNIFYIFPRWNFNVLHLSQTIE